MQLRKIDRILLENGNQLEQVDKYVNFLTICLPVRIPATELLCEAAVSSTAMLQTYRNQVISKLTHISKKDFRSKFLDSQFRALKYYKVLAYILSLLKSTEILVEMAAGYGGGTKGKWRAVLGLESLKAAIRLVMVGISRRPLPAAVPLHEPELDQEQVTELLSENSEEPKSKFASIDIFGETDLQRIRLKPLDQGSTRPPEQLLRKLSPQLALSELLAILRPVVYSLLLYKYRDRKKSWTPWLLGISMEFFSRELARGCLNGDYKRPISQLERSVYQDREKSMLWWLMRGAFFEHYTSGLVTGVAGKLQNVPLINIAGNLLADVVGYFDESYFASASL